jgi:hypothetical protein
MKPLFVLLPAFTEEFLQRFNMPFEIAPSEQHTTFLNCLRSIQGMFESLDIAAVPSLS